MIKRLFKLIWSVKEGKTSLLMTVGGIIGAFFCSSKLGSQTLGTILTLLCAMISVYGGELLSKMVIIAMRRIREEDNDDGAN